jgi:YgiT-type zinc finger domain-containing protein
MHNKCPACGALETREEFVNEIFQIEGLPILVERIPARVCARCGEAIFDRETTEAVRRLVHGQAKPVKQIMMDVFAFA